MQFFLGFHNQAPGDRAHSYQQLTEQYQSHLQSLSALCPYREGVPLTEMQNPKQFLPIADALIINEELQKIDHKQQNEFYRNDLN